MTTDSMNEELQRIRDILVSSLEYYIEVYTKDEKLGNVLVEHFVKIKNEAEKHFEKGRLKKLEKYLKDRTEMPRETRDFNYVKYIKEKTGHDLNIFAAFESRINGIIEKGKITTDSQYRDVLSKVDELCQLDSDDNNNRIKVLNDLLNDYDELKTKKIK